MKSIYNQIISRVYGHGRGWVFTPNDFKDLGSRDAIASGFKRYKQSGQIRQLARGLYGYPQSDPQQREFYIRMTRKFGWSKNVLTHQIENQSYEKSLLGQTNFDRALTPELRAQAKLAVKDEYTFDSLELGEKHSERELERALVHENSDDQEPY